MSVWKQDYGDLSVPQITIEHSFLHMDIPLYACMDEDTTQTYRHSHTVKNGLLL